MELALGGFVPHLYVCNVGARRAPAAPLYEAPHHLLAALDHDLNVAVGRVADPALEAQLAGHAAGVGAVADALDAALYEEVDPYHGCSTPYRADM